MVKDERPRDTTIKETTRSDIVLSPVRYERYSRERDYQTDSTRILDIKLRVGNRNHSLSVSRTLLLHGKGDGDSPITIEVDECMRLELSGFGLKSTQTLTIPLSVLRLLRTALILSLLLRLWTIISPTLHPMDLSHNF